MDHLIARQPIFDKNLCVFGYEIVYRSGGAGELNLSDEGSSASLSVIRDAFLLLGNSLVSEKKRLFLYFPRPLILDRVAFALPNNIIVVNIGDEVEIDDLVLRSCMELREAGYVLALSYTPAGDAHRQLLPYADILKGPLEHPVGKVACDAIRKSHDLGRMVMAEGVETRKDYETAVAEGYDLFQGLFFSKPSLIHSREVPGNKLNYLQILKEVNSPELNFAELEKIIKQDTSLCYTLLNYINSAYFGLDVTVASIRHAFVLLGEKELRKWANLILLTFVSTDKPTELTIISLARAKMCEGLACRLGMEDQASELFLTGMFSMLDVLMGRPMTDILKTLRLSKLVEEALLGESSVYGDIFNTVMNYEMGNWDDFLRGARKLRLDESTVPDLYAAAFEWAEKVCDTRQGGANRTI